MPCVCMCNVPYDGMDGMALGMDETHVLNGAFKSLCGMLHDDFISVYISTTICAWNAGFAIVKLG